jgi:outer membrane receptor for ferrienterochelin and colicins
MSKPNFYITALILLFCARLTAQNASADSVRQLQEVVVLGNFKAQGLDKTVVPTRILLVEKLAALGVQNVGQLLQYQPNLRIQQDPIFGTGMSLQGISGENVKILMDGVPIVGRQNGNIDLSQLNLLNVERIEVVEGPLSVQYGTNALAGTINIITKKSTAKRVEGQLNSYAETVGHLNVGASMGFNTPTRLFNTEGGVSGVFSAGRNFFSGWSDADTSRFKQWKPKIQYFADGNITYKTAKTNIRYASNYFDEFILNRGKPILPYQENAFDDTYITQRSMNSLNASYTTKNQLIINVLASYSHFKRTKNSYFRDLVGLKQALSENEGDQDTSRFTLLSSRGTLAKANSKKLNYEVGYDINLETGEGIRLKNGGQSINDYAVFASSEWTITEGVILRPGLRASYNTSYTAPLIPSLHIKWGINDAWTLRGSYGKGFRAPSLKELYFYFVDINHNIRGNENLQAERSDNVNIVASYKKVAKNDRVFKFEASGFYNRINNLIALAILRGGIDNAFSYVNIRQFKTFGGQFFGEANSKKIQIGAGFGLTRRQNVFDKGVFSANSWDFRANATALNLFNTGIDANMWFKHNSAQPAYIEDEKGKVQPTWLAAYNMADAGLSRAFLSNKLKLSLGIRNLFDVRNIQSQGATGIHTAAEGTSQLATGRSFFVRTVVQL